VRVGVGLPTGVPGCPPELVTRWAREAEAGPFSSLGVVDRLGYDSYDPMLALAAAAAVTERVRLVTMVVAAPLRPTAMLAKEAASLDALSGGRLVLGLALGARRDEYDWAGADYGSRGRRFSEQLAQLRDLWEDSPVGPRPARSNTTSGSGGGDQTGNRRGPELLVGGTADRAFARVARFADGYVHGGGPPRAFASAAAKTRAAWADAERPGRPQLWGQGYFALGDPEAGERYIRDYYGFTGPFVERIVAELLTTPQAVASFLKGYEDAGCDELVLLPAVADPGELARLTDAIGSL
jgi:alkanesulfonate monooxygenase SsuD/methylene tetrahydromethanopterin reductase-like flavin-dependent oxidoreductase (luciferase family)